MSTLQTNILQLLDTSTLPGLHKALIRGSMSNLSDDQQKSLLITLLEENADRKVLHKKMQKTYWRYSSALDRLEKNPDDFEAAKAFLPAAGTGGQVKFPTKLSGLKNKLNLKALKGRLSGAKKQ